MPSTHKRSTVDKTPTPVKHSENIPHVFKHASDIKIVANKARGGRSDTKAHRCVENKPRTLKDTSQTNHDRSQHFVHKQVQRVRQTKTTVTPTTLHHLLPLAHVPLSPKRAGCSAFSWRTQYTNDKAKNSSKKTEVAIHNNNKHRR